MLKVSQLFVYPIKSLGGISVTATEVRDRGFQFDRRWMLIDGENKFLSQRTVAEMSLLKVNFLENGLKVYHIQEPDDWLFIPFFPETKESTQVKIWDDVCEAYHVGRQIDEWFSKKLSLPCRLVYMPEETKRLVEPDYGATTEITSFTDGYPVMMIGERSLTDVNNRLEKPLPMNRFRPSLVFSGGEPFFEDKMSHFSIGGIQFFGVKLSSRCIVTTIDQNSATKGIEPLKTLATYRKKNNKIYFGQNLYYKGEGKIKVGDIITVHKLKESIFEH